MLRFDRYLPGRSGVIDLATGRRVSIERVPAGLAPPLFTTRHGRVLIDVDISGAGRVEVWERLRICTPAQRVDIVADFVELLSCARMGCPSAFAVDSADEESSQYLRRALAREARLRGWVPIALDVLAHLERRRSGARRALGDRSLAVFVDPAALTPQAAAALGALAQRDARPHVLVRPVPPADRTRDETMALPDVPLVHERVEHMSSSAAASVDARYEAALRWRRLLDELQGGPRAAEHAIELAEALVARERPFEARALAGLAATSGGEWGRRAAALVSAIDDQAASRTRKEWTMVDDFVGVLQLCQDVEDEEAALARVGAFLRERLQASSVAFVARDGPAPRVLTRVGPTIAGVDLALRAMDTGVPVAPLREEGPVESACPVRHASEVIGAVWCRWAAGTRVAPQQASTLLGVAAAAAAPSVRLALARAAPPAAVDNPVPELVGDSAAMVAVRAAIVRAAASPFPVVIEGESGSGKELAARAIHERSVRRARRFLAINCAALVDELAEAELFGHARGAFTGAQAERPGLFEEASGGTLFMDEIAELSARVQAKLLRVLQEHEVRRLGESLVRKVDARIVVATNRPLAAEVAAGRFRADLWYRLDVIRLTLPPLRERLEDLPALARHLWRALAARTGSRAALAPSTIAALAAYNWPGNIRELQNVLASMLVSAPRAGLVGPNVLPAHIARVAAAERSATLAEARRQFEERYVRAALARAGGRTQDAARHLGLSRQGLAKVMGRLGIGSGQGT